MLAAVRVVWWSVIAFWLWLAFAVILRRLPLPVPSLVAAILAWIVAGLTLRWTMPWATHWFSWVLQTMYG
jgi:hypothetical protein